MNTMRAVLIGVLTLVATVAFAQAPGPGGTGQVSAFSGESVLGGPGVGAHNPTPLFIVDGVAVDIGPGCRRRTMRRRTGTAPQILNDRQTGGPDGWAPGSRANFPVRPVRFAMLRRLNAITVT